MCFTTKERHGHITHEKEIIRLEINEVNSEINDIKAAISELDSEKTSLEVEMQRRISFANLELEATQLGMKKPEKEKS